ncbi:MAG TPA: hypothetical protein IAA22_05115 [Candidatus Olsenella stercoravium]|uniref:Uncharacterized protein n=1 Tax=Candidatus Olsenella stercoravium TaxID=2838713 RepID=A0A9D2DK38_9ACTN|nr:hypothetical protein [Candidatus Olsenella stercoravium]
MPTDEERREAAERLREIRPSKGGHIKWWEIAQALGLKQPAGWFGWEKFEPDSVNHLADLIEPSEPEVRCVAEVKVDGEQLEKLVHDAVVKLTGIDRDALLALADELEEETGSVCGVCMGKTARRIREACGEVVG